MGSSETPQDLLALLEERHVDTHWRVGAYKDGGGTQPSFGYWQDHFLERYWYTSDPTSVTPPWCFVSSKSKLRLASTMHILPLRIAPRCGGDY